MRSSNGVVYEVPTRKNPDPINLDKLALDEEGTAQKEFTYRGRRGEFKVQERESMTSRMILSPTTNGAQHARFSQLGRPAASNTPEPSIKHKKL